MVVEESSHEQAAIFPIVIVTNKRAADLFAASNMIECHVQASK